MSRIKTIHFHVGAHKTATTYMQSRLRSNRERLRQEGIEFVDLYAKTEAEASYRRTLKAAIEDDVVDSRRLKQATGQLQDIVFGRASKTTSLIVLSYENILGDFDLTKGGAPYPNIQHAIQHLSEAFSEVAFKLFFSFRSLDRFVESSYAQRVCTRLETRKFNAYIEQVDLPSMSWTRVVQVMSDMVGADRVLAWAYEDFMANENRVWNSLLGRIDAESLLVNPAKSTNRSLSKRGLEYMRRINRFATPADTRKFRHFIRKNFNSAGSRESQTLLDEARRSRLITNYEQSRAEIRRTCHLLI